MLLLCLLYFYAYVPLPLPYTDSAPCTSCVCRLAIYLSIGDLVFLFRT